ncbi:hypothetical protein C8Q75DRAFT_736198 [Abortiporus biennis]|nr:hypothetical protein C8Q75DRAFT_736198 [Abortiporus biennis]
MSLPHPQIGTELPIVSIQVYAEDLLETYRHLPLQVLNEEVLLRMPSKPSAKDAMPCTGMGVQGIHKPRGDYYNVQNPITPFNLPKKSSRHWPLLYGLASKSRALETQLLVSDLDCLGWKGLRTVTDSEFDVSLGGVQYKIPSNSNALFTWTSLLSIFSHFLLALLFSPKYLSASSLCMEFYQSLSCKYRVSLE